MGRLVSGFTFRNTSPAPEASIPQLPLFSTVMGIPRTTMFWTSGSSPGSSSLATSKARSRPASIPGPSLPLIIRLELLSLGRVTVMDPNNVWMPGPLLSLDSNPRREMDISSWATRPGPLLPVLSTKPSDASVMPPCMSNLPASQSSPEPLFDVRRVPWMTRELSGILNPQPQLPLDSTFAKVRSDPPGPSYRIPSPLKP